VSDNKLFSTLLRPFFRKGTDARFSLPDCLQEDSRLLCIDSGNLSDMLFHMPLLTAIRRRYPGTRMDFLMPEKHAPLIVPSGLARQCLIYKPGQLNQWRPAFTSLLRQVSAGGYELAILMAHEPQPALEMAALATGAALRLGPSHPDAWPAINFESRAGADGYLGDRLKHIAPFLGFAPGELKPRWPLPMDKVRQMAQQVHFHKPNPRQMLVGLDPGQPLTGAAPSTETFKAIAKQLSAGMECRVIPLGHPEESERHAHLEILLTNVPSGLSRETLLEVVLLLSQCDLIVAGNTDCFHFAVAMGVPTIGLFHAADPACWRPRDRALVRVLDLGDDGGFSPEELLAAVDEVAGERRRAAAITVISASAVAPKPAAESRPGPAGGPSVELKSPQEAKSTPEAKSEPEAQSVTEAKSATETKTPPTAPASPPTVSDAPVK
jgi:ADP-heptose:LPS heptosyltransferase